MAVLTTNNALGVLSAGITATATSVILGSGQGANFPAITGANWFPGTLYNAGGTIEIVKVTGRSADTLTIVRGQEGTAASAFLTGDKLDLRITAAVLANKLDTDTGGTIAGALTVTGGVTANLTGNTTGTSTGTVVGTTGSFSGALTCTGGIAGTLTGNVTGNLTGNVAGNVTGNQSGGSVSATTGSFSGLLTAAGGLAVTGAITGLPAATTAVAGVAALATAANVIAGTDTTHAVTPASLTSNNAANGSVIQFPGGAYLQGGNVGPIPSNSSQAVTFPTPFANPPVAVVMCATVPGTVGGSYWTATSVTATGFVATNHENQAGIFYWMALGV